MVLIGTEIVFVTEGQDVLVWAKQAGQECGAKPTITQLEKPPHIRKIWSAGAQIIFIKDDKAYMLNPEMMDLHMFVKIYASQMDFENASIFKLEFNSEDSVEEDEEYEPELEEFMWGEDGVLANWRH